MGCCHTCELGLKEVYPCGISAICGHSEMIVSLIEGTQERKEERKREGDN